MRFRGTQPAAKIITAKISLHNYNSAYIINIVGIKANDNAKVQNEVDDMNSGWSPQSEIKEVEEEKKNDKVEKRVKLNNGGNLLGNTKENEKRRRWSEKNEKSSESSGLLGGLLSFLLPSQRQSDKSQRGSSKDNKGEPLREEIMLKFMDIALCNCQF